jgi:hypothetical protein
MDKREIKTSCDCPPIPYRGIDWTAWFDGEEEKGEYGHGRTEEEAIFDLVENYGELE